LDFFLNKSQTYNEQVNKVLTLLRESGFIWDENDNFFRDKDFTTLMVGYKDSKSLLKLDLVNDLVPLFGNIQETELFYRTDSVQNILSNKLAAIYRYSPKDVVDIWAIAMRESIDWTKIIREAKEKEAGLDIKHVCGILKGMPKEKFDAVAWTEKPGWQTFCDDIGRIVLSMLEGNAN